MSKLDRAINITGVVLLAIIAILTAYNVVVRIPAYSKPVPAERQAELDMPYARDTVYNICNQARLETNGESETRCGNIQAYTGYEFLCAERNQDPQTNCWVEFNEKIKEDM